MKSRFVFLLLLLSIIISIASADFGINNDEGPWRNERIWHIFIFIVSTIKNVNCIGMGLYGVAFFNDNGIMAE